MAEASNLVGCVDRLINKYTIIAALLIIVLAPFAFMLLVLCLPFPFNTAATFLVVLGFSMTFEVRSRR